MKSLCLKLIFLLAVAFSNSAFGAEEISVTAEKNGELGSVKKFKLINNKCYIEKMKKMAELKRFECDRLKKIMKQIGQIKQVKNPDTVPVDGSLYKVKAGKVLFNTLAQAPRECEIKSDGELLCVNITLTESQKIILDLLSLDNNEHAQ